ncbi:MAG: hypothetical protein ABTS22_05400 [Accumulibacter sp.]|uniref:hypothetical protein n=1 Tax=Accumulibacter sp. TaxID=2053492 RepID=UPI0033161B3C
MDSEHIRDEVLARLEIERAVREQLARQQSEPSVPSGTGIRTWLDSKFGLLLIGAVISGVLVPTFQFTQEEIRWHRQNRYNNLERQLGSMRESLKQFIAVQALSAELYDLGLAVLDTPVAAADRPQREQWRKELRALQARRVQQNAVFAATVFYFPGAAQQPIRTAWNDLMRPAQQLQACVGELLGDSGPLSGAKKSADKAVDANEVAVRLDSSLAEVNQAYERVLSMLRQQLIEVEHESGKFQ